MDTLTRDLLLARRLERETVKYFDQWTSAPAPDLQWQINQFVHDIKHVGIWDLMDRIYLFCADTQGGRVDMKTPGADTAALVGTPTYVQDEGWSSSGTSHYLTSSFNATTGTPNFTRNNGSFSAASLSDAGQSDGFLAGNTNNQSRIIPRSITVGAEDTIRTRLNTASSDSTTSTVTTSRGLVTLTRNNSTTFDINKNGALVQTKTRSTAAIASGTLLFLIDNAFAITTPDTLSFFCTGAHLDAVKVTELWRAYAIYATRRGKVPG